MANRNSLEEVLVSVIYFILSNLLSLQLPCFKISVCHTNEQNFRRKRRQCFAQAATRGSWSLDSKLTRAGSLIDCWLYIFWFQDGTHGNVVFVQQSVECLNRFHSSCLSCHECAQPLSGDFWLVDGHRYCQLHRLAALPRWTCWCCDWMLNQSKDDHSMLGRIQPSSLNVTVIIMCPPLHCQVFKLRRDCKSWRGCGRGAWQDLKKEV